MKISVFLFLTGIISIYAGNSYSQTTRISLDLRETTVGEVLTNIENQSEFYFLYSNKLVDVNRKVSLRAKNKPVSNILDHLFADTDVRYVVFDRQIILSPEEMLKKTIEQQNVLPQGIVVTGKVTDEDGNPLPGVNILIKGTLAGAITNPDGNYSIEVDDPDAVLVFTFIGMLTQEIKVGDQTEINITLALDVIGLEEVIAVGYGTQRRSNLTGSVSDIKGDKLTRRNSMQTADALQGIAPGVNISSSSGQPGSQSTVRVRGIGTLTIGASASKNDPLVLIDGVEGNMNDVEPSNIESISFLKDAASGAIYGSRASNGVILIETKRGKKEELFVSYNTNMGFQVPTDMIEFTGGYEYMTGYNEALENEGKMPIFDPEYIQNWQANHPSGEYPSVDWLDVVLKDAAFQQKHSLTVNSGSNKVTNLATLTYLDQKSVMPNTSFSRYGIRSNTDIQATDRLHFRLDIKGSTSENLQPSQGEQLWYQLYRAKPNQQDMLPDGRYGVGYANINPLAIANDGGVSEGKRKTGTINAKADYKLFDNFIIEFTFAPTYTL
ncbi:MAG: SusC/RagA family TonB-linked outer membrane protein, partial [Bacteroidetes bacterium]|nr:SusC/RagA family TonB-linked outer membrane protein [Bacteroidota bacterium]